MQAAQTLSERADALEARQMDALEQRVIARSAFCNLVDGKRELETGVGAGRLLMGRTRACRRCPDAPTLLDFYR